MIVYQFLYNDCIHESSYATISLHKTKEGAEKALNEHRNFEFEAWEEYTKLLMEKDDEGNCFYDTIETCLEDNPFGKHEDWCIQEIEVLD